MNTPAPAKTENADANKAALMKDIHGKWDKITETEGLALTSKEGLVTLVAAKYGHDRTKASSEVDAVLKGRAIG
jgi:hypothetical protein